MEERFTQGLARNRLPQASGTVEAPVKTVFPSGLKATARTGGANPDNIPKR